MDSWRVIDVTEGRQLVLLMEMKSPGAGVLKFDIEDDGESRRVVVNAYFHPAGVWGLLYWIVLIPFHAMIFSGMTREIAKRAE